MMYIKRRKKEIEKFEELVNEVSVSTLSEFFHSNTLKSLQHPEFNAFKQLVNLIKTGKFYYISYYRQNKVKKINNFVF